MNDMPLSDPIHVIAEYALRGVHTPIGVSEYELSASLSDELESCLPSIAAIEAELSKDLEVEMEVDAEEEAEK